MMDGTIHKLRTKMRIEKGMAVSNRKEYVKLQDELDKATERYYRNPTNYHAIYSAATGSAGWEADRKKFIKLMKDLEK